MRILYVYSDISCSCTRMNTFEVQKGFELIGKPFDVLYYLNITESHFQTYNIIVFQRLGGNKASISSDYINKIENLISKYKGNVLTVYTIDDLLVTSIILKFISIVDLVMVPNELYLKYYGKFNSNFQYIKTFIDVEKIIKIIPSKNVKKNKFNMLWASTGLLGKKFMEELAPEICKNFPDSHLYVIGSGSEKFKNFKNIICLPNLPFDQFISYVKSCDVLLNPVSIDQDTFRGIPMEDFINCKSEVKYVTSAICKIPIITSKSYCYTKAINNLVNGVILDNNISDWLNYIKLIKDNINFKKTLINNSFKDVSQNYNLKETAKKIFKIYQNNLNKLSNPKISHDTYITPSPNIDICQEIGDTVLGELFSRRIITQNFFCNYNNLYQIELKVATYERKNKGTLNIHLIENTKDKPTVLRSCSINAEDIQDNSWVSFEFDPILNSKNKNFSIQILGRNSTLGNSVSIYYSPNVASYGLLYINNNIFRGNISFKTYCAI